MAVIPSAAGWFIASGQSATVYGAHLELVLNGGGTFSAQIETLNAHGEWVLVGSAITANGVTAYNNGVPRFWRLNCTAVTTVNKTITAATKANPVVVTSATHGLSNGTIGIIGGVVGMTQLNGRLYSIANQATNTFELQQLVVDQNAGTSTPTNVDGTGFGTYTSGGTFYTNALRYQISAMVNDQINPHMW